MKLNNIKHLNNAEGIATVESVLLLSIFVVFFTYYLGFFGVVHTGILNSISARAYAFETFRNRTNVTYLRDTFGSDYLTNSKQGFRLHGIVTERTNTDYWIPTTRSIAQGRELGRIAERSNRTPNQTLAREQRGVNPVYIKTTYGICLNQACGGNP